MMCSASGTYSFPSAFMKSYWVSTSQKMTRAMRRTPAEWKAPGNLSAAVAECQPPRSEGPPLRLRERAVAQARLDPALEVPGGRDTRGGQGGQERGRQALVRQLVEHRAAVRVDPRGHLGAVVGPSEADRQDHFGAQRDRPVGVFNCGSERGGVLGEDGGGLDQPDRVAPAGDRRVGAARGRERAVPRRGAGPAGGQKGEGLEGAGREPANRG